MVEWPSQANSVRLIDLEVQYGCWLVQANSVRLTDSKYQYSRSILVQENLDISTSADIL